MYVHLLIFLVDDEGWWQGTLHGKKGLFPANVSNLIHASSVNSLNLHALHSTQNRCRRLPTVETTFKLIERTYLTYILELLLRILLFNIPINVNVLPILFLAF